jgi:hypothetical protein
MASCKAFRADSTPPRHLRLPRCAQRRPPGPAFFLDFFDGPFKRPSRSRVICRREGMSSASPSR